MVSMNFSWVMPAFAAYIFDARCPISVPAIPARYCSSVNETLKSKLKSPPRRTP